VEAADHDGGGTALAGHPAREWLLPIAVAVTVTVAVSGAAGALWSWHTEAARPPLIRDLAEAHATDKGLSNAFNRRVQTSFPIGIPEAELRAVLERQSFSGSGIGKGGGSMGFDMSYGFACSINWVVAWKANSSGAVTEITGFAIRACL
jgi:hypothetical protein